MIRESKGLSLSSNLRKCRSEILDFAKTHDRIYLYGAGKVASYWLHYLREEEISVTGLIVSDGEKKDSDFCEDTKVFWLSEITPKMIDALIIAVGAKLEQKIEDNIREAGLQNVAYRQRLIGHFDSSCALLPVQRLNRKEDRYFRSLQELNAIGRKTGTDKNEQFHDYLKKYEFFLRHYRDEEIVLMELGVLDGASLKMWEEYFERAKIVGVDISEKCRELEQGSIEIIVGDLQETDFIESLKRCTPSIIVDDASHMWSHQIKALSILFPCLPSGGIYILEDLGTSFRVPGLEMYADATTTGYEFCSAIAEVSTSKKPMEEAKIPLAYEAYQIGMDTSMVSFIEGSCILIKG